MLLKVWVELWDTATHCALSTCVAAAKGIFGMFALGCVQHSGMATEFFSICDDGDDDDYDDEEE